MTIRTAVDKSQWFLTPCFGIINDSYYYGYQVVSIAFAWLIWRVKVQIGARKVKFEEDA